MGCTGELPDFGFLQEVKGSTDGDNFLSMALPRNVGVGHSSLGTREGGLRPIRRGKRLLMTHLLPRGVPGVVMSKWTGTMRMCRVLVVTLLASRPRCELLPWARTKWTRPLQGSVVGPSFRCGRWTI